MLVRRGAASRLLLADTRKAITARLRQPQVLYQPLALKQLPPVTLPVTVPVFRNPIRQKPCHWKQGTFIFPFVRIDPDF